VWADLANAALGRSETEPRFDMSRARRQATADDAALELFWTATAELASRLDDAGTVVRPVPVQWTQDSYEQLARDAWETIKRERDEAEAAIPRTPLLPPLPDAPPELLKALQGTTEEFWSAEERARLDRVADASAPQDAPAAPQHAEIWYLWVGKLTDIQQPGGRYIVGAGLAPTDNDTTLRMQIHAVLAAAAVCGLTYENKAWKPVAVRPELCDFLMPGGLCVHMRAERAEIVTDIAREARDTLPRIALAAPGKSNEQVVSLTLADLETLLRPVPCE